MFGSGAITAMAARFLRTSDIARELGVHPNTIRLYETWGYLPAIPRGANGYRQYTTRHLEYARLAYFTLGWPSQGNKELRRELVQTAVAGDLGMAMELAYKFLADVRVERTYAESAVELLERWAAGYLLDTPRQRVHIREAARHLNVSVDMLRNWERNGLIAVPRNPATGYRLYGTAEFGRLRVIRTLAQAGYSLAAILRMLRQFDAGETDDLRTALEVPRDDEAIQMVADRWLAHLIEMEERAQEIIRTIGCLIELAHAH
jgi:DNA-binding transcriptional MerR regulator